MFASFFHCPRREGFLLEDVQPESHDLSHPAKDLEFHVKPAVEMQLMYFLDHFRRSTRCRCQRKPTVPLISWPSMR